MSSAAAGPEENGAKPRLPELVERHLGALRSYVQVTIGPALRTKERVSDIVQSAVRELLENPGNFEYRGEREFLLFLHRVADNKLANKRRHYEAEKRAGREVPVSAFEHYLLDGQPTPSDLAVSSEELERLRGALDELDEPDRQLFSLHKLLGLTMADIARERAEPETTLRSRMSRILATLSFRMGARQLPKA